MISESEYCYMVKAELRPFRGLLLSFFFITVSIALNLNVVASQADTLTHIVFGMLTIKTVMLVVAARMLGYANGFALRIPFALARQRIRLRHLGSVSESRRA
jgi:CPA2 family monovalent cation:H+ antiporter-2